jgi:hypothetical protein
MPDILGCPAAPEAEDQAGEQQYPTHNSCVWPIQGVGDGKERQYGTDHEDAEPSIQLLQSGDELVIHAMPARKKYLDLRAATGEPAGAPELSDHAAGRALFDPVDRA